MNVFLIAGARPDFMKIAPIYRASLTFSKVSCRIIHTGQHYDHDVSQSFFDELEIPAPAYHLEAGSGSHAVQTAKIMTAFEDVCQKDRPDLVMVVGDANPLPAASWPRNCASIIYCIKPENWPTATKRRFPLTI